MRALQEIGSCFRRYLHYFFLILLPHILELGNHFKSNSKVVIAKMDATANTVRKDLKIEGFPTLFAFQKGVHHLYSGGHDLQTLITFVQSFLQDDHSDL